MKLRRPQGLEPEPCPTMLRSIESLSGTVSWLVLLFGDSGPNPVYVVTDHHRHPASRWQNGLPSRLRLPSREGRSRRRPQTSSFAGSWEISYLTMTQSG